MHVSAPDAGRLVRGCNVADMVSLLSPSEIQERYRHLPLNAFVLLSETLDISITLIPRRDVLQHVQSQSSHWAFHRPKEMVSHEHTCSTTFD
jgi:hypothetical protein